MEKRKFEGRKAIITAFEARSTGIRPLRSSASVLALMLLGSALSSGTAQAQDWTPGNAGPTDWFNANNWSPAAVPTISDNVVINNGFGPHPLLKTGDNAVANDVTVGHSNYGELFIEGGATLNNYTGYLGLSAGSEGYVLVTGAGSTWKNDSLLYVGRGGKGTLNIAAGGKVSDITGYVAYSAGSSGTVTVDGAGSTWAHTSDLQVGYGGTGTLTVQNGATVTGGGGVIGSQAGSNGTATIQGVGSAWNNAVFLIVGDAGNGTLNILAGGKVSSGYSTIGAQNGSVGIVTVDGAGTTWTNSSSLAVGGIGNGKMTISSGGVVSNTSGYIAFDGGSVGAVTVTGAGSAWHNTGAALTVGVGGDGELMVSAGGSVTSTRASIAYNGVNGTATVTGAGSNWTNTGDLEVGHYGTGTLNILNGGAVSNTFGVIGAMSGSVSTATIDGTGSIWTNTGSLAVGGIGNGKMTISSGGVVSNTEGYIAFDGGSVGVVTVTGAGSAWHNTGAALTVGVGGDGELMVSAGGSVTSSSASIAYNGANGTATVTGAGSSWTNTGGLEVGRYGTGMLNILNGGAVSNTFGVIGAMAGSVSTATIDGAGSTWANTGNLTVGNSGTGTLNILNGGAVSSTFSTLGEAGGAHGTALVSGSGSSWTSSADLTVGWDGAGELSIVNGGQVNSAFGGLGVNSGSTGSALISGLGSTWTSAGNLVVGVVGGTGSLAVEAGGKVNNIDGVLGFYSGSTGSARVDGAGSKWANSGNLVLGRGGVGTLTLSNGGTVSAAGTVMLAEQVGSTGVLNIGAAAGSPAGAAGTLSASSLQFGSGTGTINFNHTNTNYVFAPAISGLGTINHFAGTTTLSGDSSGFTGLTNIVGGKLLVDGKLGSLVDVQQAGALGGSGLIGGDVNVADGGTLLGIQGQTLTMQNLNLSNASNVNVTLSSPGGAALFNVVNDLTLDGALNITSGGAFGPGVYALMTYGGILTDNGLDIGSSPAGSSAADFSVQTSVLGQVNLVSTALPNLAFWDGDGAGNANNNIVDGGSGVWTAASTNWTDLNGTTNGVMHPQPGFAIFQGTAGTVTADASAGAIAVTGMQFASDGYQITGAPITLADPNSIIRVGDGSAAGANYKATIGSVLTGTGGLNKTDYGTLILTADNDYTGGTTITGGTLQLGNGGTSGSVVGDILNKGLLVFNRSDVSTYSGAISSGGAVGGAIIKNGSGTINLTGNSSGNNGHLTVNDGTLAVKSGGVLNSLDAYAGWTAGTTSGVVVDGTGSALNVTGTLAAGGAGTGTLTVANGGKVTNANGFLGFGSGSAGIASVAGAGSSWVNNGSLVIGNSGTGSLTIADSGTVNVGGVAALAVQTGSAGTLNIGGAAGSAAAGAGTLNAGTLAFGQGTGTLNFNHTDTNYTFASSMLGTGTINQIAGNTNLTGNSSSFTGAVNVKGGRLAVNGALGGGQVTVSNGGTLGGNGLIGSLTANAGSIVAPGNSIGTLNVAGNASFAAGSTYQVELNSAGQSDLINIAGTATLSNGALLSVVKTDAAPYVLGTHYTVLTAAGGLTGTFTFNNVQLTNFIGVVGSSDANNYYLDVTKTKTFASAGLTPNQIATAGPLDTLPLNGALTTAVANLSSDAAAQYAFDQLSGEIHASAKTAMIEDSRFVRSAVNDRLRAAFDGVGASGGNTVTYENGQPRAVAANTDGLAFWGQGFGSWGHWNGDGNAARLNRSIGGFFMGADAPVFDTWRFGAVAGYSRSNFDVKDRHSSGTSDNYHLGLYGGTQWGNLAFRTGAAYTWHDISTARSVNFAGFGDSLKGDYNAGTAQVFGELGYKMQSGNLAFEPFANLAYVNLHTDGFTEKGGAAALTSASANTDATYTTLGLRASTSFDLNGAAVTAKGMLGWRHAYGDVTPNTTMLFAGGGDAFSIGGVPIARNAAVVEAGFDFALSPTATLGLAYGGQFGSGVTDQTFRANFNVKF